MQYDPIKRVLGNFFNKSTSLRILFYKLLDLLLLRSWHVRKDLRIFLDARRDMKTSILDAGFGFGQYSWFMSGRSSGITVKGIDVKEEQVADCGQFFQKAGRNNASFSFGDLTTFVEKENFDLILCVDVMEHILEDVTVFRNFHASLKNDGMLLVSTPSDQGGSDVHDHDEESSFIDEHVRDGYSIADIEDKLRQAGFSRIESNYAYGTWGRISWRLSMKYPIILLNISKLFLILLPFYYIIAFPFALILNYADVKAKNSSGTGLIVKAFK
jgi:SAM-dependent methyltransferase